MKVRVYHQARGPRGIEDICIDIEMPFLPAIGMDIKPTPDSDYLRVQCFFWDISTPDMVDAHIEQEGRLETLKVALAAGWRKA